MKKLKNNFKEEQKQKKMEQTDNIVNIKNLNIIYNKGKSNQFRALEGVNLEFKPEEWVIIFGPSGCGKSTLLNSIAGLKRPTSGKVSVLGRDINSFNSDEKAEYRRKLVGMVFQSFHLIPSLSVIDNVCLPQIFWGQSQKKRREMAMIYLKRFGISDQADKYPSNMSGGQRQRVSIARALINQPEIILADEPVGNLDSKSTYNVMAIFRELNQIDKKTIIMVTHDREHLKYADRVVHIRDGKVIKVEVLKKKKELGKDSSGRKVRVSKDVEIPMDLKLLMKSFGDLSNAGVGRLMEPFKVKQTFSYLMLPITNYQVEQTQNYMNKFFLGNLSKKDFVRKLDASIEDGGAGWDKRSAKKFVEEVSVFCEEAQKIDYSESLRSAKRIAVFFIERYPIKKTEFRRNILIEIIEYRLRNEISKDIVKKKLSLSINSQGLGLNLKTAEKISRELELLILIRYSG